MTNAQLLQLIFFNNLIRIFFKLVEFRYMFDNFFKLVDLSPENVHILDGNAPDLNRECEEYERKIKEAGGIELFVGRFTATAKVNIMLTENSKIYFTGRDLILQRKAASHFGSYTPGKLRGTRLKGRNSAVQSTYLDRPVQKSVVQYDINFTPVFSDSFLSP